MGTPKYINLDDACVEYDVIAISALPRSPDKKSEVKILANVLALCIVLAKCIGNFHAQKNLILGQNPSFCQHCHHG